MKWTVVIAMLWVLGGCVHRIEYTLQVGFEPRPVPASDPTVNDDVGPPATATLTWKEGKRIVQFPGVNQAKTIGVDVPTLPFDHFTFYEFTVAVTKEGYKPWIATYDSGNFVWDDQKAPPGRRIDVIHLEPTESPRPSTRETGAPDPPGDGR